MKTGLKSAGKKAGHGKPGIPGGKTVTVHLQGQSFMIKCRGDVLLNRPFGEAFGKMTHENRLH
jgi:hypothetical protein